MTEHDEPLPAPVAVTLLCVYCSRDFGVFPSGEMAVRVSLGGVNGWREVTGEHLDELTARGLLALPAGVDEVDVTPAGRELLDARGWLDGPHAPNERGRYWLRRAVREDDRRSRKPLLASARAAMLAMRVLRGRAK